MGQKDAPILISMRKQVAPTFASHLMSAFSQVTNHPLESEYSYVGMFMTKVCYYSLDIIWGIYFDELSK
jgi:hypothetical protein